VKAPFEELAALDRLIHEPARLALLTALTSCESADFLYLQRITGLSKGNLSSHLSKLEESGLVTVEKHWKQLEQLRDKARNWVPQGND
jgi:DNA-binding transcriptional ArsR family regulator